MNNSGARILVICYANICRSAAGSAMLAGRLGPSVDVFSRGVHAFAGARICPASGVWAASHGGTPTTAHQSTQLELADIRSATLILTASRRQRAHVVQMRPSAQVRTFTIAQAGRIAAWHQQQLQQGGPDARPAQLDLADRVLWLTEELNAWRAAAPMVDDELDDVPDPHRGGTHVEAFPQITAAIDTLCELAGATGPGPHRPGRAHGSL